MRWFGPLRLRRARSAAGLPHWCVPARPSIDVGHRCLSELRPWQSELRRWQLLPIDGFRIAAVGSRIAGIGSRIAVNGFPIADTGSPATAVAFSPT
jgi:hypothetical protein